ncbi:hypothetical protein [Haloechinothrix halophila]|uniref:hypothetical protein n=1 Tax=Haloechinothrix halophila TaxID=1069073 RepID=UPI0012FABA59|nr:hypothetical protein [Haloechinothrix halophila]
MKRPRKPKAPKAKTKVRKTTFRIDDIVEVVGDGGISGRVAEGVNIPVLILDTTKRPDIAEIVRAQQHLPPGDVVSQWAGSEGQSDDVLLVLDFARPIEKRVIVRFSIEHQAILVECALAAGAVYLQAGKPGDRILHDVNRPKMLVEINASGFRAKWDELLLQRITTLVSDESGSTRREAEPIARELIQELQKFARFRMPRA